jgi:hypothetical protein
VLPPVDGILGRIELDRDHWIVCTPKAYLCPEERRYA